MTDLPVSAIWRTLPGTLRFQPSSLLTNLLYWDSRLSMQKAQSHDFVLCKPLEISSEVSGLLLTQYGDKNPLRGHSLFPVHTGDQASVSRCPKSPDPRLCPPIPLLPLSWLWLQLFSLAPGAWHPPPSSFFLATTRS